MTHIFYAWAVVYVDASGRVADYEENHNGLKEGRYFRWAQDAQSYIVLLEKINPGKRYKTKGIVVHI